MQKKIIALAIAAAFSAPAFADNANISIYGKAILNVESVNNDKSALSQATRVQTNASRLGFKGKEDLGDGMSAWFQYEVQMDADGNGSNGLANGTRNSGVGIDSGFGTIMMGVWDTPFKLSRNKMELFDNTTVFSAINLMGRSGSNTYNTRRSNVVQYWSPSLGGVKVNVSHSPDEATATGAQTTAGANKSQTSLSAVYDDKASGVYVAAAYEMRPDATTKLKNDGAMRLVARYEMGDFWVGATVESITVNTTTTANYTQNNMELAANMKMGASSVGLSYAKAGETATTATGASQISLRYGMNMSKRTELFAAYTSLKNDTAGAYSLIAGTAFGAAAGSTSTAIGAGVVHSF